jgi:exodeoxyribonuclease VII small subunit
MEEKITFETALARLQTIVSGLESGNVPLDESLSMFEEGVKLVKFCNEKLDHAEQKVKILLKDGEDYREQDFAKTE